MPTITETEAKAIAKAPPAKFNPRAAYDARVKFEKDAYATLPPSEAIRLIAETFAVEEFNNSVRFDLVEKPRMGEYSVETHWKRFYWGRAAYGIFLYLHGFGGSDDPADSIEVADPSATVPAEGYDTNHPALMPSQAPQSWREALNVSADDKHCVIMINDADEDDELRVTLCLTAGGEDGIIEELINQFRVDSYADIKKGLPAFAWPSARPYWSSWARNAWLEAKRVRTKALLDAYNERVNDDDKLGSWDVDDIVRTGNGTYFAYKVNARRSAWTHVTGRYDDPTEQQVRDWLNGEEKEMNE